MVRTALVALSVAVVLTAAGAVVHGVLEGRGEGPPPDDPASVAAAAAAVMPPSAGVLRTAGGTGEVGAPNPFTLRELHDGDVSLARFAAFWEAELERIRSAPCPGRTAPGSTVVGITVAATPPPHLGEEYPDYAPRIAAARTEATAACA